VRQTLISYIHIIHKIGFGNPYCAVFFLLPANKLTQRCTEVDKSAEIPDTKKLHQEDVIPVNITVKAAPQLKWLFAGFPPLRSN
jgi:hypothetical protein